MSPWWSKIALAFATVIENKIFGDSFSNIDLRFQTVDASIRLVGGHHYTAHTAATKVILFVGKRKLRESSYILFA